MNAPATSHPSKSRIEPEIDPAGRSLQLSGPDAIATLPEQRRLRIDVNGTLAGSILAVPDCPRELATGWAFMHRFFGVEDAPDRVTVDGDRISVMVASGEDIDRRRLEAVGWADVQSMDSPEFRRDEPFMIGVGDLFDVIDATWNTFRHDGAGEGYVHAAAATRDRICCVARDTGSDMAMAKVLGWMVLERSLPTPPVLIVRGSVRREEVDAAARLGVEILVTSGMPTADAFRAATGYGMSLVGKAISRTARLLVDGGHVVVSGEILGPA